MDSERDSSPGTSSGAGTGPGTSSGPSPPAAAAKGTNGTNGSSSANAIHKRTRVLLSCATCRASKLKCDRQQPCGQCVKKGKPEACEYAPKPVRQKPAKGMAARLRRLEGMVRDMMDGGVELPAGMTMALPPAQRPVAVAAPAAAQEAEEVQPDVKVQVVTHGENSNSTTFVGATHFMAILEDIEDLKSFFDEPEVADDDTPSPDRMEDTTEVESLLFSQTVPRTRDDLLALLPPRGEIDSYIMVYFMSNAPSVHIVHKPTFSKQYAEFCQNPYKVPLHWLALLFMVCGAGSFFSALTEANDSPRGSPRPILDRYRTYRSAAACALVQGRYTHPGPWTLQPLILYAESEFITARASQTQCYLLCSVVLRLMLKMGLHRDPSKLPNLSPFEGEMRRRFWSLACQIDLLVSFHMGLPSMAFGIESDTQPPRNLLDEDFGEATTTLPPARPKEDYTTMTYPINKAAICRVFGLVAKQAHALHPPTYAEVMEIDRKVTEAWAAVPAFMKTRPLAESVTDSPVIIIQRFGLESIHNKSRCVLHRRYLNETPVPRPEHDRSRAACLDAALQLLSYQRVMWEACQPGRPLRSHGWFVTSLAVHDYLLAAMVVYLVIRSEHYPEDGKDAARWMVQEQGGASMPPRTPSKAELVDALRGSHDIWVSAASDMHEVRKATEILATMLGNVGSPTATSRLSGMGEYRTPMSTSTNTGSGGGLPAAPVATGGADQALSSLSISDSQPGHAPLQTYLDASAGMQSQMPPSAGLDPSTLWAPSGDELDWTYFDTSMLSDPQAAGVDLDLAFNSPPAEQIEALAAGLWDQNGNGNHAWQ